MILAQPRQCILFSSFCFATRLPPHHKRQSLESSVLLRKLEGSNFVLVLSHGNRLAP